MSLVIAEAATFTFGCALIHRYGAQSVVVTATLTALLAVILFFASLLLNWQAVGLLCTNTEAGARFPSEFCGGLVSF
ncbi:hypothetical protein [Methylobacterium oxalidis]|uniref:hypothetical protein n=1 Tax=Methylobacterium oxalidis TaxID=944322 RepID=UPI0011BD776E|nr:hypothetical protein [Methylobacterium oxalidis]